MSESLKELLKKNAHLFEHASASNLRYRDAIEADDVVTMYFSTDDIKEIRIPLRYRAPRRKRSQAEITVLPNPYAEDICSAAKCLLGVALWEQFNTLNSQ